MKRATLLWADLEMTGLDPEKDRIMEVACIATDWELTPLAKFTATVRVPDGIVRSRMTGPFWEKNKSSYDSLVSANPSGRSAPAVEQDLLAFLDKYFKKGKVILAGNSIHQDRKFIDREWPALSARLHYRMLDVSAWKVFFENALNQKFQKPEAHRALSDIEGSIEELQFYLSLLKTPPHFPPLDLESVPDFNPTKESA